MNPSDGGRNQGRRRPRSGFSEFGADPFFGGGMMGSSGLLNDFFGRDPFDDPFFNRPMGMGLFGGGSLLGRNSPFGGMGMGMPMTSLFDRSEFFTSPDGAFLDRHPFQSPHAQPERRRGPIIEELTDDADESHDTAAQNGQDPVVEHPEDDDGAGLALQRRDALQQTQNSQVLSDRYQQHANNARQSNTMFQGYSFHSSSSSFGGSGGSFYSSSSMRRMGPDGVVQEEHVERDHLGKETRTSARGLRDQVHAVTKKRHVASGPETMVETLRNLTPEEAPQFNAQWEAHAERSLPGWNRGRAEALEGNFQRLQHQVQPALRYHDEGGDSEEQPLHKKIKM